MRGRARRSSFHGSSTWELLFSAGIRGPSTGKGPEEHPTGVCSGPGTATSGQTSQQRGKHFLGSAMPRGWFEAARDHTECLQSSFMPLG